jgi:hypothetical protein
MNKPKKITQEYYRGYHDCLRNIRTTLTGLEYMPNQVRCKGSDVVESAVEWDLLLRKVKQGGRKKVK